MTDVPSTLERPQEKYIRNFRLRMVQAQTIRTFLQKGWSLAICCKDCPRVVEWTPPELERRFGDKLDLAIATLAPRLSCTGPEGCGSHDIAVFPHPYDDADWRWRAPAAH